MKSQLDFDLKNKWRSKVLERHKKCNKSNQFRNPQQKSKQWVTSYTFVSTFILLHTVSFQYNMRCRMPKVTVEGGSVLPCCSFRSWPSVWQYRRGVKGRRKWSVKYYSYHFTLFSYFLFSFTATQTAFPAKKLHGWWMNVNINPTDVKLVAGRCTLFVGPKTFRLICDYRIPSFTTIYFQSAKQLPSGLDSTRPGIS